MGISSFTILMFLMTFVDGRIWTIYVYTDYPGGSHFNEEGWLAGYMPELIDLVCAEGRMDCRVVVAGSTHECWTPGSGTHPTSGAHGLLSRRFDGCMGTPASVLKLAIASFTREFFQIGKNQVFTTLKGKAKDFNPHDLKDKVIAFRGTSGSSPSCLRRHDNINNNHLKDDQIVLVPNRAGLMDALKSGRADAVFGTKGDWRDNEYDVIERVPGFATSCHVSGNALAARKDSALVAEWNVAFSKLVNTNRYSKFCLETSKKYAHRGRDTSDYCPH